LATGIRGGITGRRADLVIIDDPIKSQAEADKPAQREFAWQWYRSDLTTRLKPRGKVVLIMTRWHEEDLGGKLLEHCGPEWRVLRLPALAEENDPLGRTVDEPLWPEWEAAADLARKRMLVGERVWASLFQQSPRPPTGGLFRPERITRLSAAPVESKGVIARGWDLAATFGDGGSNPDWTVGVKLLRDAEQRLTILDVVRLRGSPLEVEDSIIATTRQDGDGVWVGLPEDPGQAGKSQASYLTRRLCGFRVLSSRETGSKTFRALPLASQIEAGNVTMMQGDWNRALIEELRDFPLGRKDDQVDALVRAFQTVNRAGDSMRRANVPLLAR
jgi:predicted phage terminase large subunit-like protein